MPKYYIFELLIRSQISSSFFFFQFPFTCTQYQSISISFFSFSISFLPLFHWMVYRSLYRTRYFTFSHLSHIISITIISFNLFVQPPSSSPYKYSIHCFNGHSQSWPLLPFYSSFFSFLSFPYLSLNGDGVETTTVTTDGATMDGDTIVRLFNYFNLCSFSFLFDILCDMVI